MHIKLPKCNDVEVIELVLSLGIWCNELLPLKECGLHFFFQQNMKNIGIDSFRCKIVWKCMLDKINYLV